ncbi:MAG: ABC transporter ATP-binding protein [Bacteroidia bacterium]
MSEVSGNAFDWKLLRWVLGYTRPYRNLFSLAIFLTITLSFMSIGRPMLIRYTVNHFVQIPDSPSHESYLLEHLLLFTIIMIGLLVLESVMQFVNGYTTSLIGQHIVKDLRVQMHRKIIHFKSTYFDNTPIGTLVTRVISDIEAINDVFSQGFIVIAGDLLTIVVYLSAMLYVNWKITLVVLTTIPLMFLATWIFKNAVKKSFTDVRNQVSRLNAFVQEHITGMLIVQVFNREKTEYEKFKEINAKHRDANVRSVWYYSVFFPVVEILVSVSLGLLVWFAGKQIYGQFADPGDVTFFVLLINQFFRPIRMLADRINTLQMGMVASERVFKVLDTDASISNEGERSAAAINGEISFKEVWFAYKNEDWVLKGISFDVHPGETIALVGATGSGKTSIINLLNRNYEFNKGAIEIDGQDIRSYELNSLRSEIGVVLQDVFLFSDSILNNITLNNPDITEEQVIAAAKAVGVHDFIMSLPGGYHYNVQESGSMLSVGQRQLLAFIRAYVYNPRILVLDEATSSIDTESEFLIQKATAEITRGRTSIVIAHRLATIQKATKILVMDHGQIIESGSHHELLAKDGQYKKLFELQFHSHPELKQ